MLIDSPQTRADQGPRALKIRFGHFYNHDRPRCLTFDGESFEQSGVCAYVSVAINTNGVSASRDEKHQSDTGISYNVTEAIDPVVSATVRENECL